MKDYKHYIGTIITHSGREYPDFALGTYLRTEDEILELLKVYPYDKLMIDTVYRYNNEQAVSSAVIKSGYPQNQIVYIGKINTGQQESGNTVREEFEGTLHRLRIPKINIYMIHSSRSSKYCKTWIEMIKLQNEGLIDSIGVSNFGIAAIEKIYNQSGVYPEINQIVFPQNASERDMYDVQKIIEYCQDKGISVQAAMPFGGSKRSNELSELQRLVILKQLRSQDLTCVFGTKNIQHLCQNISWIEFGR